MYSYMFVFAWVCFFMTIFFIFEFMCVIFFQFNTEITINGLDLNYLFPT
jgi:hypothetical protein